MPPRRALLLLVALVALVAWITVDAAERAARVRAEHVRRAIAAAEQRVRDRIADPEGWIALDAAPARHPFERPEDYEAALAAAEHESAWRAARAARGRLVVVEQDGEPWLVQRAGERLRARRWQPLAASILETGTTVDLAGDEGLPFLAGLLSSERGMVTARVERAGAPLAPWLDVPRAVGAVLLAGLLVREVLRARHARERERAREVLLQRISHELRTPAASIRSLGEALAAGAVTDPGEQRQFLDLVRSESERLAVGIDRLLRAARGDEGIPVAPVAVDLAEWARNVHERWSPRLAGLRLEAPDALVWRADPDRLDEAVDALLDNAAKYGGANVVLAVERAGRSARIAVRDDGPGVPPAERARVFERLQRVEGRPGDPGGYGLGLWAAAEVARAHGGALALEGGACFVITLPEAR